MQVDIPTICWYIGTSKELISFNIIPCDHLEKRVWKTFDACNYKFTLLHETF